MSNRAVLILSVPFARLQHSRANREKSADPDLVSETAVEIQLVLNERPGKPAATELEDGRRLPDLLIARSAARPAAFPAIRHA